MRDIRDKARQLVPSPERTAAKLAELFLSTSPAPRPREALLTGSAAILAAFWTLYLHRGSFAAIQILPKFSGGY